MTSDKGFAGIATALFFSSIVLSLFLLKHPNYGGDELWFATPLVWHSVTSLDLFQFEYAGPIKAVSTWPIFKIAGFSIVSLRLFSLATFVIMVAAWCFYLRLRSLHIATAATLIFFALNPDLQFFSRNDINQPTLHNLLILVHVLAFLRVVERGPTAANAIAFVLLSFVNVNTHIRNVWILNAFVIAFLVDQVLMNGVSKRSVISAIRRGWPVALGWATGAAEFAYVIHHFEGSGGLESAKSLGHGYTWELRAQEVADAVPQLVSGGRVLATGYGVGADAAIVCGTVVLLVAMVLATMAAWGSVARGAAEVDFGRRLVRIFAVVWVAVTIQYAITKSARWAWHGNGVSLFWAVTFGLTVQALWSASRRKLAIAYAALVFVVFGANRIALERSIESSIRHRSGFELGVWNSQCLDDIREYVRTHPADYIFSDWSIGRALALELHFRPQPGTTATLYDSAMPDEMIQVVRPDQVVLRAVGTAVTVPDMSDARMTRLEKRFESLETFKDAVGREAYQLGHIVAR